MIESYRDKIMQLVDECTDMSLLDFIWRTMLYSYGEGFDPGEAAAQEVERNEHDKGNMLSLSDYTDRTRKPLRDPAPNRARVVSRGKKAPTVCGADDRGTIAA